MEMRRIPNALPVRVLVSFVTLATGIAAIRLFEMLRMGPNTSNYSDIYGEEVFRCGFFLVVGAVFLLGVFLRKTFLPKPAVGAFLVFLLVSDVLSRIYLSAFSATDYFFLSYLIFGVFAILSLATRAGASLFQVEGNDGGVKF